MSTTVSEWATIIGLPLVIAQTVYVALTYHNRKVSEAASIQRRASYGDVLIMSLLALASWSLLGVGIFLSKSKVIFSDSVVERWYFNDGAFRIEVNGGPLLPFSNDNNLVLYVKSYVPYADRMTDTHGVKSRA